MNILITGHKGFIGYNLVKHLEPHHHVIGIDIKDGNDVLDQHLVESIFTNNHIDTVIHLAATPGVGHSIEHSQEVLHNNIIGFDTIAKTACKHHVRHVIYASSSSIYGDDGTPKSPYAVSKKTNELQASVYSNLYPDTKFTGLRFFTVYGPNIRQDLAIYKFIKAIKTNTPIHVYGDGSQSRDFTYVDDICEAIKRLSETNPTHANETFDIGYGQPTTVNDLIKILKSLLNPDFNDTVYEDEKPYDVRMTKADTTKLYQHINFKPRYDIETGLKMMLNTTF